jgi:hypothetical protein
MDWQGALRSRLIDDGAVAALVGNRIYWVERPQTSSLPAITLQVITEDRPQNMNGFVGMDSNTVQLDIWGNSYAQVQQAKEAALSAIVPETIANGVSFERAFISTARDLGEMVGTQFIHRASLDLIFHHSMTA